MINNTLFRPDGFVKEAVVSGNGREIPVLVMHDRNQELVELALSGLPPPGLDNFVNRLVIDEGACKGPVTFVDKVGKDLVGRTYFNVQGSTSYNSKLNSAKHTNNFQGAVKRHLAVCDTPALPHKGKGAIVITLSAYGLINCSLGAGPIKVFRG